MSKLFVFDMDGTILNSKGKIQKATIESIEKARNKNHNVIIATGRPFRDAIKDLKDIEKHLDYVVCNNGTYYAELSGQNIKYFGEVPQNIIPEVIKLGQKNNCFLTIHGSKEAKRAYLGKSTSDKNFKSFEKEFISIDDLLKWIKTQHISQISLKSNENVVKKMYKEFNKYKNIVNLHIADNVYLDINPKGISKIIAVKNVAKKLRFKIKNIIAFGDSGNDLQMLEEAGLGICMGNGNSLAKKASDIIIGSNDTNAIGDKILEIINGK